MEKKKALGRFRAFIFIRTRHPDELIKKLENNRKIISLKLIDPYYNIIIEAEFIKIKGYLAMIKEIEKTNIIEIREHFSQQ